MKGRKRAGLVFGGIAVLAIAATAGALLLLRSDGEKTVGPDDGPVFVTQSKVIVLDEGAPDVDEAGRRLRPHVRLEHPGGAIADVPGGPVVYGTKVDIERMEFANDSPAWDRSGIAWRFVSNSGLTLTEAVTLDLPAKGDDAETVIALTAAGTWMEVPSSSVTLVGGPGLRITVQDIPAPWMVAVARPLEFKAPPEPSESNRLDALFWTDRQAWEKEVRAWIPQAELVAEPGFSGAMVSRIPAAADRTWWSVALDLRKAEVTLGAGRYWTSVIGISSGLMPVDPLELTGPSAYDLYASGINQLQAVRSEWVYNRTKYIADSGRTLDELVVTADGQNLEQAIESALYNYAPWGIEFTRWMLKTGTASGLDLRVLRPYGQIYSTDVAIPDTKAHANETVSADIEAAMAPFIKDQTTVTRHLRLYSTWAIEDTSWLDVFRAWKGNIDYFLRYYPLIEAAAGWVLGTLTPTGLAVMTALALADQAIDYLGSQYQAGGDGQAWAQFEVLGDEVGFSTALPLGLAWAESASKRVHLQFSSGDEMVFSSSAKDVISNMIDVALTIASLNTNWYMLKDVRALTEGSRGYCPRSDCGYLTAMNVPPVQLFGVIRGNVKQSLPSAYPMSGRRLLVWDIDIHPYGGLAGPVDLHSKFVDGGLSVEWAPRTPFSSYHLAKWPGGVADLQADLHRPAEGDQKLSFGTRTEPSAQIMRLAIPRDVLNSIAIEYGLGSNPSFEDYGMVVRIETPDGHRNNFELKAEGARRSYGDKTDHVYVTLQLKRDGFEFPDGYKDRLLDFYNGEEQTVDGKVLRTTYTVTLKAHSDQDPRLSWDIDFTSKSAKLFALDQDAESPRLHFLQSESTAPANLYRLTRFERGAVGTEFSDMVYDQWRGGQLASPYIVACEIDPGACFLSIYTPKGSPTGTLEVAIVGPDKNPANGLIIGTQRAAEGEVAGMLNFVNLVGQEFRGQFFVDLDQRRECGMSLAETSMAGYFRITALTDSEDPRALLVDGFPRGQIGFVIEGTRVK